jgi:hypothetical protein
MKIRFTVIRWLDKVLSAILKGLKPKEKGQSS